MVFAVPEDAIPSISKHPNFGAGLAVSAYDRAGGQVIAQGTLTTIDNVVDPTTGTVKGKASFPNPSGALFPNQFVNVILLTDTLQKQVIVPTTAVRHGPSGDYVFVLQANDTVKMTTVTVGPGTAETTSIAQGLTAGQTVITDGGDRLRDGAPVTLPGQRPPCSATPRCAAKGNHADTAAEESPRGRRGPIRRARHRSRRSKRSAGSPARLRHRADAGRGAFDRG